MDRYEMGELLGVGAYGTVFRATDRISNQTVALKEIILNNDNELHLCVLGETSILFEIEHPNIVRLERVFVHNMHLCMVFEDLAMDLNVHMGWYEEKYPDIVKGFLRQILTGISYCHSRGILHRDMKPHNLLIDTKTDTLKLADFGSARGFVSPNESLSPEVVKLSYRAPELLLGSKQYSASVDMWSIGCIFAEMVTRKVLFDGSSEINMLREIFSKLGTPDEETLPELSSFPEFSKCSCKYLAKELKTWVPGLEPAGVDLLSKLLCMDPEKRILASEALDHPYFRG